MALSQTDPTNGGDRREHADGTVTPATVLEVLDAAYTQDILEAIQPEPKSARELAEECGASRPTVYRRLNSLQDAGLVGTDMLVDADGHHRTVFEPTVERVAVELTDAGLAVRVDGEAPDPARSRPAPRSPE
jgi:DNA-binding HxlR family transcriptional regulator